MYCRIVQLTDNRFSIRKIVCYYLLYWKYFVVISTIRRKTAHFPAIFRGFCR